MKLPINNLRRSLRDLRAILDREADAIRARNYELIVSFNRHKKELIAACEEIMSGYVSSKDDEDLLRELESVRRKAEGNASLLDGLRTGLSDAKQRLEALIEEDRRVGLYARTGHGLTAQGSTNGGLTREV